MFIATSFVSVTCTYVKFKLDTLLVEKGIPAEEDACLLTLYGALLAANAFLAANSFLGPANSVLVTFFPPIRFNRLA
jgi:hypothetical protein